MSKYLRLFFDWCEVWALIIPLVVLYLKPKQPVYLRPVIIYLCIGFLLNLSADIIGDFKDDFPWLPNSNNVLYNIHSVIRFVCFVYFFFLLRQPFYGRLKKILLAVYGLFMIINFTFIENFTNPDHISGNLFTAEAFILLSYCLLYYLSQLKEDVKVRRGKDFWVVTGISIYVVANFFIFLFYVPMLTENFNLADNMWDVHDVAYIILCIFIAKAFYDPVRNINRI